MKKFAGLFLALFVFLGALFAPAMGASLLNKSGRSASSTTDLSSKKSQKKKCKKLKKKIKKAKSKKAKKRAKKKYNKKCKCKKLKKKIKKAKSAKKKKRAKKKYAKKCKGGGGSGGGGSGGGGGGGSGGGGGGGSGGGGSGGGTKTTRESEQTYVIPALGVGDPVNAGACPNATNSCGIFPTEAGEIYVTIEITDTTGLPVGFSVGQDSDPATPGTETDLGNYCGKTDTPINFDPGYDIVVFPWFIGGPGCPGVATTGSVKATFSNLP